MYDWRRMSQSERRAAFGARLASHHPWHGPPHERKHEYTYHFSAACYEHAPIVGSSAARMAECETELLEALKACSDRVHAWCVLPNHYHLLVHVTDFQVLGGAFRMIHGPTSRQWNHQEDTPGRKVWYRFSDRAIRSERHYYTTLNYIHYNPVKHGWKQSPYDWVESSVHWYLEHQGREWLRDLWNRYPVRDYGLGWDDV